MFRRGAELVDRLAVELGALARVADLARPVQQRVDGLVAACVVFRLPWQVWNWWMLASGSTRPLQPIRKAWSLPASSSFRAEANSDGPDGDVEAGLLRHPLDHLAHAALRRLVLDRELEAVAAGRGPRRRGASWRGPRLGPDTCGSCRGTGSPARWACSPTVYWPSQTTWFRASRSIESSSASRTRGSLASGVPRSPGGAGLAVLVAQVDGDPRVGDARSRSGRRTWPPSSGWPRGSGVTWCMKSMSPERRLASRTLSSVMIRKTSRSNLRLARVEVVRGLLEHDAVLGDALREGPGPDAHGRGPELVVELVRLRRARRACRPGRRGWP